MNAKRKLLTPILLGVLLLLATFMVIASQQPGTAFTPPVVPPNNGYDQLIAASKLISPQTDQYNHLDEEVDLSELKQIVEQNGPALKRVDEAMSASLAVPVDWSAAPGSTSSLRLNSISSLRSIARALSAQSRWQRETNSQASAIESAGKIYRLGTVCGHGGLLNDYFVGLAIRGMGLDALRRVDTRQSHLLQAAITAIIKHRENSETADEVIARESLYIAANLTGLRGWMMRGSLDEMLEPTIRSAWAAEQRVEAQQGLLLLHLALHKFRQDHGSWPKSLHEISAAGMSSMPLDPFSNQAFIYQVTDGGYRLYSVGENKIDDGGVSDEDGLQPDLVFDLIRVER